MEKEQYQERITELEEKMALKQEIIEEYEKNRQL